MRDDDETLIEYDDEERRLFASLPREAPVAPGSIDRAVERLVREGVLRAPRPFWARGGWGIAAALLLFAGGVATGRLTAPRASLVELLGTLSAEDRARLLDLGRIGQVSGYARGRPKVDTSSGADSIVHRAPRGAIDESAPRGAARNPESTLVERVGPPVPETGVASGAATPSIVWY